MDTVPAKTILTRNKDTSWFGSDYNMNLYRGCSHGCIYCDSRSTCYHVEDFDRVRVKENALALLRDELRRKVRTGVIGSGAMCDSYNSFERTELVTRHALELMDAFGFGASMLTKSPLILRDTDLYQEISTHSPVLCMMTITTADDGLSKKIKPGVPASSERFAAVRAMADQDLPGVVMTPLLPFWKTRNRISGKWQSAPQTPGPDSSMGSWALPSGTARENIFMTLSQSGSRGNGWQNGMQPPMGTAISAPAPGPGNSGRRSQRSAGERDSSGT